MKKRREPRVVLLGPVELLILRAVIALEDDAYGITIYDAVRTVYSSMSFGSVYTGLERLSRKGYLESWMGEPEATRGGRAKKYYSATDSGKKAVEDTLGSLSAEIVIGGEEATERG